jgi:hypothetical protein
MSQNVSDKTSEERVLSTNQEAYEPPLLTPLGNARELLAGADGSITDMVIDPENPIPTQQGT